MTFKRGNVEIEDIVRSGGRNIIDIRRDREETSLRQDIHDGLNPREVGAEKRLPTLLLYDEAGLKLFEEITYLDEYYLTNTEIELLERQADSIARHVVSGSIVVELGSGNLRKVDILLKAIDKQQKQVEYYALDLSLRELERTLAAVPKGSYNHVQCFGLHGTYDDGLAWLQGPAMGAKQKMVLSLGSSIGNFDRPGAAQFLSGFADKLNPTDKFLIALDGCKDADTVYHAYNDREGVTHRFIQNGLEHANKSLGETVFDMDVWTVTGEYDVAAGRHHAFVSPSKDTVVAGVTVKKDEMVRIEESYKYDADDARTLWQSAGLESVAAWTTNSKNGHPYTIHMVSRVRPSFGTSPQEYASSPVPSLNDWDQLWQLWDTATRDMIPDEELHGKPIKLRNACIFYLGHIPTFFDIKLAEVSGGVHTHPEYFTKIFERGIDPDVDNPEQCHAHSEIPDDWPPLDDILDYQTRVRQRVAALYDSGAAYNDARIARAIWLGYEHEAMHLETLLYMLVQSDKTKPPPSAPRPDFEALAKQSSGESVPLTWTSIPASEFEVGLEDPETTEGPSRFFGWDVEKPPRTLKVAGFEAASRPITVREYANFLEQNSMAGIPASWTTVTSDDTDWTIPPSEEGTPSSKFMADKAVRTIYGPIPLRWCLDWPACASYDELAGCASWMGGRIPTLEEARSIYTYAEDRARKEMAGTTQRTIPAVNSHLVNEGVEESPTSRGPCVDAGPDSRSSSGKRPDPAQAFTDLTGVNVGFQHWHPMPVTSATRVGGLADFGGLWEWTASPLRKIPGWSAMPLYPAYSADFYDEKHNIVLGGSWATVPRIAGRKSFVNWYQRNYLYTWAGARLVRDV